MLVLAGPTASGKTAVAGLLAQRLNGEIVNADAFQIYRGLPILTAQPGPELLSAVPHHLVGVLPLADPCSAAKFREMAVPVIERIRERGRLPILCGGTGLYIKAITHGLDDMPPANPELRNELERRPLEYLIWELCCRDPLATTTVDLQNPRRVIRALEICIMTGKAVSELRSAWAGAPSEETAGFSLLPERQTLHRQIETRVDRMFAKGVVEEVRSSGATGVTASQILGLAEIRRLLSGELVEAECKAQISARTRQYAKRQTTWFRKEMWMRGIAVPPGEDAPAVADLIQSAFEMS